MALAWMQVRYAEGSGKAHSSASTPLEDFFHKGIYQNIEYRHIERSVPVKGWCSRRSCLTGLWWLK